MKTIEVSSAIVIKDKRIFITQRGHGDFKDKWEFPGGKLEAGESAEQCIVREIKEELNADIEVVDFLNTSEYAYPKFNLIMHNYICRLKSQNMQLLEHKAAKFVHSNELDTIDFLPADLLIIQELKDYLSSR